LTPITRVNPVGCRSCWLPGMACENSESTVLERKDAGPDCACQSGRTLRSLAVGNGRETVMKLALGRRDVNPDSACGSGRTPLSWAAANGHESVVNLLLRRKGANSNTSSKSGQTPLTLVSESWHDGDVTLLQARHSRTGMVIGPPLGLLGFVILSHRNPLLALPVPGEYEFCLGDL